MREAGRRGEWEEAAEELDRLLTSSSLFKLEPSSPYYDHLLLQNKTNITKHLLLSNDVPELIWHLRKGLLRRQGGLAHPQLFSRTYTGTKVIAEEYISQVCEALRFVARNNSECDVSLEEKLSFYKETKHSFGTSALLLSGGVTLGIYHMGVLKTLWEENMLPKVISGSSAGSIIAAFACTHTDDQFPELFNHKHFKLNFFERLESKGKGFWNSSFFRRIKRFLATGTVLDINILGATIRDNLGDITFREAYEKTGRILNISVTPASKSEYPRLLNYLTSPHVVIWSACLASCAIPFVFSSVSLLAKDKDGIISPYHPGGLKWQDGTLHYDLPMNRLTELFNINNFIVSQVNPHVIFLSTADWELNFLTRFINFNQSMLQSFAFNFATNFDNIPGAGLFRSLGQNFSGDITIKPAPFTYSALKDLMVNPTHEKIQAAITEGQRRTWKSLSHINAVCAIEFTLDSCIKDIEGQILQQKKEAAK